jgi:hypothetical protein
MRVISHKFGTFSVTRHFKNKQFLAERCAGFLNFVTATDEVGFWRNEASPEKGR